MPQHREDARPVVSHGASLFLAGVIFQQKSWTGGTGFAELHFRPAKAI